MPYVYEFPRPAVTVDCILFSTRAGKRSVLLIRRGRAPCKGMWAVPGGFVDEHEDLDVAVARELEEETGLAGIALRQFRAFGKPGRDPRGHTVTIAYVGHVPPDAPNPTGRSDADEARWVPVDEARELAFDHGEILALALREEGPQGLS